MSLGTRTHKHDQPRVGPVGPPKIGWRVREWSDSTGCSVPTTYRRIKDGTLKTRQYGGVTLILGFADEQTAPTKPAKAASAKRSLETVS